MTGRGDIKMALVSLRGARWRSMLTMLGIVFGVLSVVTVVGIGEGVKQQIGQEVSQFGKNLITIRPGHVSNANSLSTLQNADLLFGLNSISGLSEQDLGAVQSSSHVAFAAPLGMVPGTVSVSGLPVKNTMVIATNSNLPGALSQGVLFGDFFNNQSSNDVAVMSQSLAQRMFGEFVPLGHVFRFRGQNFLLGGIFANFNATPLSPTANFNNAIFIPYQTADQITGSSTEFYAILAKPDNNSSQGTAISSINRSLLRAHGGQHDFSVLTASQEITSSSQVLNLLTDLITGIAIVSLVLGGVGIMNVMLVSVTERTHEIGVRKAIGATNRQILNQFMLEALVLSVGGAFFGVLVAVVTDWLLRVYSSLRPALSVWAILISTGVSILVGVVFGVAPAIKAARKDPIDALRRE